VEVKVGEKNHATLCFPFGVVLVQIIHSFGGLTLSSSLYGTQIASKSVVTSLVTVCPRRNRGFFLWLL